MNPSVQKTEEVNPVQGKSNVPFVKSYKTVSLGQLNQQTTTNAPADQTKETASRRNRQTYMPAAVLPQKAAVGQPTSFSTPMTSSGSAVSSTQPGQPSSSTTTKPMKHVH